LYHPHHVEFGHSEARQTGDLHRQAAELGGNVTALGYHPQPAHEFHELRKAFGIKAGFYKFIFPYTGTIMSSEAIYNQILKEWAMSLRRVLSTIVKIIY
jgi:hypothetical protein